MVVSMKGEKLPAGVQVQLQMSDTEKGKLLMYYVCKMGISIFINFRN